MDERIQKYLQDELSSDERLMFLQQTESDAHLRREVADYQNLQALFLFESRTGDQTEGIEHLALFRRKMQKQTIRTLFMKTISAAAVVILLMMGTWFAAISSRQFDTNDCMHTLTVPAGQRACLTLEDGTEVWLNAQSTLTYPARFSEKERKVILSGEAFLTVEKDTKRPFIVSTQGINIEVLGTTFNVQAYPETNVVQTSLLEGSVKMYPQSDPSNQVILQPNQEASYSNGALRVSPLNNVGMFSWREGIYSFDNEPFSRIVDKLQLYYDVKIVVKDPVILDFEYSGKFRQRDGIYKILQVIQKIKKFKIEIDEENNIITLKK